MFEGHNAVKAYQAFSNDPQLLARLKEEKLKIDLLFIDGDHSYDMVISDFESFAPFVNPGGWIVFDDYMDHKHSPEVQPAVNDLSKRLREGEEYLVLGPLPNIKRIPEGDGRVLKFSNEFVIRKQVGSQSS